MTKAEAIQTLLECDWLDDACKNIGKSDWEELRQRFWIVLLEQREDIFEGIRGLQFYCVRMVMNEYTKIKKEGIRHTLSERFQMHFKQGNLEEWTSQREMMYVNFDLITAEEQDPLVIIEAMRDKEDVLGRVPMYDRVIYKLHEKGISCRKIAEFTSINRNEINATVNRVKEFIAANVKYERASN